MKPSAPSDSHLVYAFVRVLGPVDAVAEHTRKFGRASPRPATATVTGGSSDHAQAAGLPRERNAVGHWVLQVASQAPHSRSRPKTPTVST